MTDPENTPTDKPLRTLPGEADVPWAMQLALRIEKAAAPTDLEACEAAARACVALIDQASQSAQDQGSAQSEAPEQPEDCAAVVVSANQGPSVTPAHEAAAASASDGNTAGWFAAVEAWRGVAIRKIVRRCRGKRWEDAQDLPGVTIVQGNAAARAFVPAPVRPLPPELAKMQVEGTDLASAPSTATDALVTVRISPLLDMTTGKTAAQCAHAAQRAWESMDPHTQNAWRRDEYRVHVVRDSEESWAAQPGQASIVDAGFTELDGQHETTRANWNPVS